MIERRTFLRGAAALGAGIAGGASLARGAWADEALRLYWWGTPDRAARTQGVVELFQAAHPGAPLLGETSANDYWSKLTTMIAGGNAPDVFALEPGRFAEYSRRGACLDLSEYVGGALRLDRMIPDARALGTVDGKMTGTPIALNALAMFYQPEVFEAHGIAPPNFDTPWDEFATRCIELTKAIDQRNVWAVGSASKYLFAFQIFVRQRGRALYTEQGEIAFTVEDAADWFGYWDTLAKNGGCSTAEFQAMDNTMVETMAC